MSFTGTPLGQGRRLDHRDFLNKPNHPAPRAKSPPRNVPTTSYAYGAPTLGTKSPPKSSSRDNLESENDPNEPALARFARLKREQSQKSANVGPRIITEQPQPDKWSVKDTSVNIATAFQQAASGNFDMQTSNPNSAWASGSRPLSNVPRSTSVEYEAEKQQMMNRRLAPPPSRQGSNRIPAKKPLSKNLSVQHVSDSEGESNNTASLRNGRGKSPFEAVADFAKQALAPATYYLKQRSAEPEDTSGEHPPKANGNGSYDYSAEEREIQAQSQQAASQAAPLKRTGTMKRGRMSTDNKAYRPTASDLEDSDDDVSDDGKRRRRKSGKKGGVGGPLTSLPVAGYDKKKRRKAKGSKGNVVEAGEDESAEEEQASEQQSTTRMSVPRGSMPPPSIRGFSAQPPSIRGSVPPPDMTDPDASMDVEQGLDSIEEVDEIQEQDTNTNGYEQEQESRRPRISLGALLGSLVYRVFLTIRGALSYLLQIISVFWLLIRRVLGQSWDILCSRPAQWLSKASPGSIGLFLIGALLLYSGWNSLFSSKSRPSPPTYQAPTTPISDLSELSDRLQRLEAALSGISLDHDRARSQLQQDERDKADLRSQVAALQSRLQHEILRAQDAEREVEKNSAAGMQGVKQDLELFGMKLTAQDKKIASGIEAGSSKGKAGPAVDEEAREKFRSLEERLGGIEGDVKQALDLGKNAVMVGGAAKAGAAWWNKLGSSSGAGITIKSADGQDVTGLIEKLVDTAAFKFSKDSIGRPDFADSSAGAKVIPTYTSPTIEISGGNFVERTVRFFSGVGTVVGRPPITALHHDTHNGYCWPLQGRKGSLGVSLASPVIIDAVTIDHVPADVSFSMRSAPRDMRIWGMVEGEENLQKLETWREAKQARLETAKANGEDVTALEKEAEEERFPGLQTLLRPFVKLGSFTYDATADRHIQTFPISEEIRELGIDFGIVVLQILNNWGQDEYTCLYRFRVHGASLGGKPEPTSEDPDRTTPEPL